MSSTRPKRAGRKKAVVNEEGYTSPYPWDSSEESLLSVHDDEDDASYRPSHEKEAAEEEEEDVFVNVDEEEEEEGEEEAYKEGSGTKGRKRRARGSKESTNNNKRTRRILVANKQEEEAGEEEREAGENEEEEEQEEEEPMLSPTPVMAASFDFNCLIQEWKQVEAEDKEEEEAEANEKEEEKGPKENEKKETNQQQEQQCNKTLAVFHPKCLLHVVPEDHFETPQRLEALIKCLTELKSRYPDKLDIYDSPPKCDLRWIKVVHDATYINKLLTKVPASASAQPCHATLSTQEQHNLEEEASEIYVDTFVSHFSWKAALHASGCVLYAVDRLFGNENGGSYRNAICAVRPPGHHCGRTGRTGGVKSQGFCLINNVVVGAKYALLKYDLKRIAVVDFDVHAGNGTEELLRGDDNFLFISLHAHGQNFYPGTGGSDQPSSTSTASDTIATRGNSHRRAPQPSSSTAATTARASTRSPTSQRGLTSEVDSNNTWNIPLAHGTGSATYRKAFMKAVALLDEFKPELIFASAGFDAHKNDPIRGGTAIGMKLSEDDFRWITRQLVGCSERHCNGRLISVLEGGYDVAKALPASFRAHVAALLLPSSSSSSLH